MLYATASGPTRGQRRSEVELVDSPELALEVVDERRDLDRAAHDSLQELAAGVLGPVSVDVLAQPLPQPRQLPGLELVVEVGQVGMCLAPKLAGDQVAQRI